MTRAATEGDVSQHNVKVFRLAQRRARLIVPGVLTGVGVYGDDAAREQLCAGKHRLSRVSICQKRLRGTEQQQPGRGIEGDGVPDRAAALLPPLRTRPGLGRRLDGLALVSFLGLSGNGPEAPQLLARAR